MYPTSYFLFLPLIIAIYFCLKLLAPNKKKNSNKYLGCYFLLFALILSSMLIVSYSIKFNIENALINISSLLFYVLILSVPQTFYLYVSSLSDLSESKTKAPHYYIPILLLIINIFSFSYLSNSSDTASFMYTLSEEIMNYANFIALLFIFPLMNVFYIYKSIIKYIHHRIELKNVFSFEKGINLKWMFHYILGYIIFMVSIYFVQSVNLDIYISAPIGVFMIGYLSYIGHKGLNQVKVCFNDNKQENTVEVINNESSLKDEALIISIKKIMIEDSLYLNSNLTIHELSKKVKSNSKTVSSILNSEFKQNFVTFVNQYRIDKAKEILIETTFKNYTIEAISEEVGFNSKTAFNRAFKQFTDSTPSEFRKIHVK